MKTYDYLKQESEDVIDFIQENYTIQEQRRLLNSKDNDAIESLYERLFNEDCVTGNGSGSYTFNTLQAERNLVGNWDILRTAIDELDPSFDAIHKGAEACDVLVRIYLLPTAIDDAITKLWKKDENS